MVSSGLQFQSFRPYFKRTGYELSVWPFVLVIFHIIYNGLIRATISVKVRFFFHSSRKQAMTCQCCLSFWLFSL